MAMYKRTTIKRIIAALIGVAIVVALVDLFTATVNQRYEVANADDYVTGSTSWWQAMDREGRGGTGH
jgi:hypothetical protein